MLRSVRTILGGCLVLCLFQLPALALGPVDGEVGLLWWQSDFDRDTDLEDISTDASAPGIRGELWFFNKLGVRASLFSSDLGDLNEEDADNLSADVMWRLFSPTENTFLALGAGWQDLEFTESGVATTIVETSGPRATLQGRVGLVGALHLYGHYSYMPELEDFTPSGTTDLYTDLEGNEFELGLFWKMGPFFDMRAGYRASEVDFTAQPTLLPQYQGTVDAAGFMVGMGIHF